MARKKNLERAIILGLILSTGVYGSAWAENPITEDSTINSPYTGDVTFQGDNDTSAIEITDKKVTIETTNGGTIKLDSEKYGIRLEGNGSVTLKPTGDNIITVTTNNTSPDDVGDGINVTKDAAGTITLNGGNNTITVTGEHSDGIYTAEGNNTKIEMNANSGDNTINADNNGIDHRGDNTITLKAENGSNIIKTTAGDGVRVDGIGNVTLTAKENTINAGDNGIQSETQGTISIISTNGDNNINAATTAIEVSYGNVIVNSNNDVNLNTENFNGKDVGAGIHLDYGNNNGYGTNEKALYVDINAGGNFNIGSEATAATSGIQVDTFAGTVDIDAQKGVYMNVNGDNLIGATESGHIIINAKDDIILNAESNGAMHMLGSGYITNRNNQYVTAGNDELIGINGIKNLM